MCWKIGIGSWRLPPLAEGRALQHPDTGGELGLARLQRCKRGAGRWGCRDWGSKGFLWGCISHSRLPSSRSSLLWLLFRAALGAEQERWGLPFCLSFHHLSSSLSPLSTRYAFRRLDAPGLGQNQGRVRMVIGEGGLECVGRLAGCGPGRRPSWALEGKVTVSESESGSVMSDSWWPHGL